MRWAFCPRHTKGKPSSLKSHHQRVQTRVHAGTGLSAKACTRASPETMCNGDWEENVTVLGSSHLDQEEQRTQRWAAGLRLWKKVGSGTGPEENRTETILWMTLNCVSEIPREQKPDINIGTILPCIYSLSKLQLNIPWSVSHPLLIFYLLSPISELKSLLNQSSRDISGIWTSPTDIASILMGRGGKLKKKFQHL